MKYVLCTCFLRHIDGLVWTDVWMKKKTKRQINKQTNKFYIWVKLFDRVQRVWRVYVWTHLYRQKIFDSNIPSNGVQTTRKAVCSLPDNRTCARAPPPRPERASSRTPGSAAPSAVWCVRRDSGWSTRSNWRISAGRAGPRPPWTAAGTRMDHWNKSRNLLCL